MFETARIRAAHRHFGSLSLSVLVHAAVVVAILGATLSSATLPVEPPKEILPVVNVPPLPLAAGTPEPAVRPHTAAAVPHAPVAPAVAPRAIPDAIVPAAATSTMAVTTTGTGSDLGVPDGVRGGIPVDVVTPPPPAPDAAGPLPVGGAVKAPVIVHQVDPIYPRVALQAHLGGSVVVECIIDKSGHIRDVRVVRSSLGAFEQPAVDAVQQWIFTPGTLNGQPVDTIFRLTVQFVVK